MPIYKIPVNRGKYTSYTDSKGVKHRLPNYFTVSTKSDYDKLSKFKWQGNPKGYAFTVAKGLGAGYDAYGRLRPTYAHAYISRREEHGVGYYKNSSGLVVAKEVDHANRLRYDNRRENLRQVTAAQNIANRDVSKRPVSGNIGGGRRVRDRNSVRDETRFANQLDLFNRLGNTSQKAQTKARNSVGKTKRGTKEYAEKKAKAIKAAWAKNRTKILKKRAATRRRNSKKIVRK